MKANEIITSRVIDFPRDRVWRACSDPVHLARWWGPHGFTNTIHEFDLRPGGVWKLTMHGPDGVDYANGSVFTEVIDGERIAWDRTTHPLFSGALEFTPEWADRTRITMRMICPTREMYDMLMTFAPEKNEENLDRLERELRTM